MRVALQFRRRGHRAAASAVAMAAFAVLATSLAVPASAVVEPGQSGSAMTLSGKDEFAGLKITVSETRNLRNQSVEIRWSGATPTPFGNYFTDVLQVMQCWGDAETGPERTQCQFGALGTKVNIGTNDIAGEMLGRLVLPDPDVPATGTTTVRDPLETLKPASPEEVSQGYSWVPFWPFSRKSPPAQTANLTAAQDLVKSQFNEYTTNELLLRSTESGTGSEQFEVQTVDDAPGLGCGSLRSDGSVRNCWLVVVPRNDKEVDGTIRNAARITGVPSSFSDPALRLQSSALNATNWAKRIVFPLEFASPSGNCPLGRAERPTSGSQSVEDAVLRWQPALCNADGGAVYSYSSINELSARRILSSAKPNFTFMSRPLASDQVGTTASPVYAPLALSGIGVAFNIQHLTSGMHPDSKLLDGQQLAQLDLTPRLVAKLLTNSYLFAGQNAPHLAGNPGSLLDDPEFIRINPTLKSQVRDALHNIVLPAGLSDAAGQVWSWIESDPEAKSFLAGSVDPYGMKVNKYFQGLELPRDDFPAKDEYCAPLNVGQPSRCYLDFHPYAENLYKAARAAGRGDPLSGVWSPSDGRNPARYRLSSPQRTGKYAVLAITDTAAAQRYGLKMARLRNAAGVFVGPNTKSLLAGASGMMPTGVPGVVASDPLLGDPDAYPLTQVTYGATDTSRLSSDEASDYSRFIRYAVVSGQVPGNEAGALPEGFVPLPQRFREQALDVAEALTRPKVTASATPPTSSMSPTTSAAPSQSRAPSPTPSVIASPRPSTSPSASPTAAASEAATSASAEDAAPSPSTSLQVAVPSKAPTPAPNQSTSSSRPPFVSGSGGGTGGGSGSGFGGGSGGTGFAGNPQLPITTAVSQAAVTAVPSSSTPPSQMSPSALEIAPTADYPVPNPVIEPTIRAANSTTPGEPLGPERYALVALLALGLTAAISAGFAPIAAAVRPLAAPLVAKAAPGLAKLAPAVARLTASTAPVRVVIGRRVSSVLAKLPRRGGV